MKVSRSGVGLDSRVYIECDLLEALLLMNGLAMASSAFMGKFKHVLNVAASVIANTPRCEHGLDAVDQCCTAAVAIGDECLAIRSEAIALGIEHLHQHHKDCDDSRVADFDVSSLLPKADGSN